MSDDSSSDDDVPVTSGRARPVSDIRDIYFFLLILYFLTYFLFRLPERSHLKPGVVLGHLKGTVINMLLLLPLK